jgi:hypothetical protein
MRTPLLANRVTTFAPGGARLRLQEPAEVRLAPRARARFGAFLARERTQKKFCPPLNIGP